MSTILVFLETEGKRFPKGTLSTIRAALEMKAKHNYSRVVGLVLHADAAIKAQLSESKVNQMGLDEILLLTSAHFEQYVAGQYQLGFEAVLSELSDVSAIVGCSSAKGKDLMPRLAQRLEAGQVSDAIEILSDQRFRRPMYAGNIIADVEVTSVKKVVTVRSSAFAPADIVTNVTPVRELKNDIAKYDLASFVSYESVKSERPELSEAEIVVSGGRALKSAENFEKYINPLADALGAAIGASRAAVDSGYAPNDWQVGQTGKVVAPKLYLAVGISGAIQHLAGMKDSKVIVAINKDPEAPIFEVADYGLVGDLFEIVPKLTEAIKNQ
jgi:electron transfer flavoprotein alpha subunit